MRTINIVITKSKPNLSYQAKYNQKVLGYRDKRTQVRQLIDTSKRVNIIYDHVVHRKDIRQMI